MTDRDLTILILSLAAVGMLAWLWSIYRIWRLE